MDLANKVSAWKCVPVYPVFLIFNSETYYKLYNRYGGNLPECEDKLPRVRVGVTLP